MKQFMVLLATLPIMLIFLAQFTLNLSTDAKLQAVDNIVYTAKEAAKQEGGFSPERIAGMRTQISRVCGVSESEIKIDCSSKGSKKRMSVLPSSADMSTDKLIHYCVKVPMKEINLLSSLVRGGSDTYYYVIDNYTASEYI